MFIITRCIYMFIDSDEIVIDSDVDEGDDGIAIVMI